MKWNRVISLIALLILLSVACTAGGEEAAAPADEETATPESGLATVPPTEDGSRAPEEEVRMQDEEAPTSTGEDQSTSEEAITPVEVDLSDVTPQASTDDGEEGETVEMPEPGRPNPQRAMVNKATQDLAERLEIEADDIEVVEAEEMQWRDSSLGCPAKDGFYLQAITPGYRITLQAKGETYDYHTDTSRTVILCGPDGRPAP